MLLLLATQVQEVSSLFTDDITEVFPFQHLKPPTASSLVTVHNDQIESVGFGVFFVGVGLTKDIMSIKVTLSTDLPSQLCL